MTQLVPIVSSVVQQFDTLETRRKLGAKCVPQLFLESLLGTRRSAIRDFKIQQRGRQQERQKTIGLISKTTTSHVHHTFLYISFRFLHDYNVKMPNFSFHGGRK